MAINTKLRAWYSSAMSQVDFKTRMGWTLAVLVVFLSASQIPLYGVPMGLTTSMPSEIMRIVLASGQGTIMDLGR